MSNPIPVVEQLVKSKQRVADPGEVSAIYQTLYVNVEQVEVHVFISADKTIQRKIQIMYTR